VKKVGSWRGTKQGLGKKMEEEEIGRNSWRKWKLKKELKITLKICLELSMAKMIKL
jgi:hypothetical protein